MFEEGNKEMKELLGGKGANLAEMTATGLPVPYGFTITTATCQYYYANNKQHLLKSQKENLYILKLLRNINTRYDKNKC